jgi:putative FmdB family regulatory protein
MPLYEYKCTNCAKISEFILKYGSAPTEGCKFCGEKRLEKILFSTFAVGGGSKQSSADSCSMKDMCGSSCGGGSCKFGGGM